MPNYFDELADNSKYTGNVVVRVLGEDFTIRAPDSGLNVKSIYNGLVGSLVLNPTTVDLRRVSTTIAQYSVRLIDRNGIISRLVKERGESFMGQSVEIFVGRSGVDMDFSDYYQLPTTRIKKISLQGGDYTFNSAEESDRMNRPVYDATARLSGSILAATTASLTSMDDISAFPSSGYLKIGSEFIGYSSKNNGTKQFLTLTRGEFNSTAADHEDTDDIYAAEQIEDNPLNILLKILCSNGGGGIYDTLNDGLAIDAGLIDIDEIESIRDELYSGVTFRLVFSNISSALNKIENEILQPCNLRLTYSRASKITVAVLDRPRFIESVDLLDDESVTKVPQWDVDDTRLVNSLTIDWDYNDATDKYQERSSYTDADSIALYGVVNPTTLRFQGARADIDGQEFVDDFANAFLSRLSRPTPQIKLNATMAKSLLNVGDKTRLESSLIPNPEGKLQFAEELEVVERSINFVTGDVQLKLAFTSFTGIRTCYIAPSDTFSAINSQSSVDVGVGRGSFWDIGWKVRLWNNLTNDYEADAVNEILSITDDTITFANAWTTILTTDHRLKFSDYDDATDDQKRYCFVSATGADTFADGGKYYSIIP